MRAIMDQRGLTEWPCTGCGSVFPAEHYCKRNKKQQAGKAPRHTMCNRCLYVKYTRPIAERKAKLIAQYKLAKGCTDCGYALHPAALEFDHLPGTVKLFNIGEQIGNRSLESIWTEIDKCDVVCANCHNIRTADRRVPVM